VAERCLEVCALLTYFLVQLHVAITLSSPLDASKGPATAMQAINERFDYHDRPQPVQQPPTIPAPTSDDDKPGVNKQWQTPTAVTQEALQRPQHLVKVNLPLSEGSGNSRNGTSGRPRLSPVQDEQIRPADSGSRDKRQQNSPMMLAAAHFSSPLDSGPAKNAPNTGGKALRTHFSWKKGFLTTHKPPTCRQTPASMLHQHMPPVRFKENPARRASLHVREKGVERVHGWPSDEPRELAIVPPLPSPNVSSPGKQHQLRFHQQYDLRICLYGKHGTVYSEWEALTNFLLMLQAYDRTIQLHPWRATDHNGNNPDIEISRIPNAFFDLHTYVP